eukprot:scaffold199559_cov33-Tisochrysis_lutea.AAC.1
MGDMTIASASTPQHFCDEHLRSAPASRRLLATLHGPFELSACLRATMILRRATRCGHGQGHRSTARARRAGLLQAGRCEAVVAEYAPTDRRAG